MQKRLGLNTDAQMKRSIESFKVIKTLLLEGESDDEMSMFLKAPSFFLGPTGPFTLGAILYAQQKDEEAEVESYVNRVLKLS